MLWRIRAAEVSFSALLLVALALVLAPGPAAGGSGFTSQTSVESQNVSRGNFATLATVAGGTGTGPALGVAQSPYYIALSANRLVASDLTGNALRSVVLSTRIESTLAGNGFAGYRGDGGPAAFSELDQPAGVATDVSGDIFVADQSDSRIREIPAARGTFFGITMQKGDIYTVAGDGNIGFSGDGGRGTAAEISLPEGLAVDPSGDLYFADSQNGRVREVAAVNGSQFGIRMHTGDIYTIGGDGKGGDQATGGDGGPASAAGLGTPQGVSLDASGDVLVTQDFGELPARVRLIAAHALVYFGVQMVPGDIYTVAGGSKACAAATDPVGDGCPATGAVLEDPVQAVADPVGNLFITDYYHNRVREVSAASGTVSTVAGTGQGGFSGDGGPASQAEFAYPTGLVFDTSGNLFVSDSSTIRRIDAMSGKVSKIAGNQTFSYSGNGGPALRAQLGQPDGIALDPAGDVFVADTLNNVIREVPAASVTGFGTAMKAGHIYTLSGLGTGVAGIYSRGGFAGDGGSASNALLDRPKGLALDSAGDIYVVDAGNARVREISATAHTQFGIAMGEGDIYTVAGDGEDISSGDGGPASQAGLLYAGGLAVDREGNLFIAESGDSRVREVAANGSRQFGISMVAGDIYTIAGTGMKGGTGRGGKAADAALDQPSGVAADSAGDVFVTEAGDSIVDEIAAAAHTQFGIAMSRNDIYTVAGNGKPGFSGDGASATKAKLKDPGGMAVDSSGDLWIADAGNHRIREVAADGVISTVAGSGTAGFARSDTAGFVAEDTANSAGGGNSGPASSAVAAAEAELATPSGIAIGPTGDPYATEFSWIKGFAYEDANGRVVKVRLPQ